MMVDNVKEIVLQTEWAYYVEPGKGIQDSGYTSPVMGEKTWEHWLQVLQQKSLEDRVQSEKGRKVFKFGNGNVSDSTTKVTFPVKVFDEGKELRVSLIPGSTPLVLARSTLSDWGVVQDFRNSKVLLLDRPQEKWKTIEQSEKGTFCLIFCQVSQTSWKAQCRWMFHENLSKRM
jgi:hypothetical protein